MKATITTLLLAFAPALPIISALPSEKRLIASSGTPITEVCSGLSITPDGTGTNSQLHADTCDGVTSVVIDLDSCIGNFGGALDFATDGDFSDTCDDCSLDAHAVMSCFCGQGVGKDFILAHIDLSDCRFFRFDQATGDFDCTDSGVECPNRT